MLDDDKIKSLKEPKRSRAAKLGWKKWRAHYNAGIRKRQRKELRGENSMKELITELYNALNESKVAQNNVFKKEAKVLFEKLPGGIGLKIEDDGVVSLTTTVGEEIGNGSYKTEQPLAKNEIDNLYKDMVNEINTLCQLFDTELQQILDRHGLLPTK